MTVSRNFVQELQVHSAPEYKNNFRGEKVKCLELEADHSPQFSSEVENKRGYIFTLQYVFMTWCL